MDLQLSEEQQQLTDAFAALYAKEAGPDKARANEPAGFDQSLWRMLVKTGVIQMAVSKEAGGWEASLLDLALIAELGGRYLAAAPTIEAQVAARLLSRFELEIARDELTRVLNGETLATIALHPSNNGRAALVPAAAVANTALVLDGTTGKLLLVQLADLATPVKNTGDLPLADIALGPAVELASGEVAQCQFAAAIDEWCVLTAAALVGLAARALEIAVEYAHEREAFGRPIGAFQAVGHRLADVATSVDGARLLTRKAAWAQGAEPARFAELASMALAFSSETARTAGYWGLHFHGGYGFMLEYDIQLFFRRAWAWGGVLGEPGLLLERVADQRYGSVRSA